MDVSLLNGKILKGLPDNVTQRDLMGMALQQGLATQEEMPSLFPALFDTNKPDDEEKPELPKEEADPSLMENIGGMALDLGGKGVLQAVQAISDLIAIPMPKAAEKYTTDKATDVLQSGMQTVEEWKPDEYREAQQQGFIEEGVSNEEALSQFMQGDFSALQAPSWQAVIGTTLSSLPQMPAFVYGGGAALKGVQALKFFAKHPKLAQFVGYGATNAALVAPGQWRETYTEAIEMGMPEDEARDSANAASTMTALISGATGGAGGVIGTKMGMESGNMASAVAKGFVAEAPFEGLEEMGQSAAGDVGLGRPVDIVKAAESGALGALAGGVPGAGVAAVTQMQDGQQTQQAQDAAAKAEKEERLKLALTSVHDSKVLSDALASKGGYEAQPVEGQAVEEADPIVQFASRVDEAGYDSFPYMETYEKFKLAREDGDFAELDNLADEMTEWESAYAEEGILLDEQTGFNGLLNRISGAYATPSNDSVKRKPIEEVSQENFDLKIKPIMDAVNKQMSKIGLTDIGANIIQRMEHVSQDLDGNFVFGVRPATTEDQGLRPYDPDGKFVYSSYIKENGDAYGVFDGNLGQIFMSLDSIVEKGNTPEEIRKNILTTLDHETVHALRFLDLFNKNEWNTLLKVAEKRTMPDGRTYRKWAEENYSDKSKYTQEEEAIAQMVAYEKNKLAGKPRHLIDRIGDFFVRMSSVLKGTGFNSFNSILSKIESGEVGGRERGQVNSLYMGNETNSMAGMIAKGNEGIQKREAELANMMKVDESEVIPPLSLTVKPSETIYDALKKTRLNAIKFAETEKDIARVNKLTEELKGLYEDGARRLDVDLTKAVRAEDVDGGLQQREQRRGTPQRTDPDAEFETPEDYSRVKQGIWRVQDKLVGLKDVETAINKAREAQGLDPLDYKESAYRGEEASHGKIGEKGRQFQEGELQDLVTAMASRDVDMAALDEFLVLRHALERNAQIKKINPGLETAGAGSLDGQELTDEYVKGQMRERFGMEWDAAQGKWFGGDNNPLNQLAKDYIDPLVQGTLEEARAGGLITRATYEHLSSPQSGYRYYTPLRGFGTEMLQEVEGSMRGGTGGTGGSVSIMGKQTQRAKGRGSEAYSPTATLIADRERTIARGIKNKEIGEKLHKLVLNNPNKDVWEVIGPGHPRYTTGIDPNYTYIGPETDTLIPGVTKKQSIPADSSPELWTKMVKGTSLESVLDPNGEELVGVKINGEQHYIDIKDDRLRQSLLNLDGVSNSKIVNTLGNVNRVLSAVNTTFNPEFVIGNFFRDIQTAIASIKTEQNMEGGQLDKLRHRNMVKKIASPKALAKSGKDFYKAMQGKIGELPHQEQRDIQEFLSAGAKADWFHSKPPEQQHANIQQMLEIANNTFKGNLIEKRNTIKDFVENGNAAVENAVRFSAFREARDAFVEEGLDRGEAVARAASMAKNMTINFNRKGESGNLLNSLYLFFNAQVQGTAVILRGMSSPTKQKIMGSIVTMGAMMSMLHEFAEDDEEDGLEKVQDFVRERNMIIPNPFSDTDIKIPLPYGYNFFYQLGSNMYLTARGKMDMGKAGLELGHTFLGSFSPIGAPAGEDIWQSVMRLGTPTAMTPAVEMAVNRNYFGSPIYKEDMQFGTPVPDSHRTWKNSNEILTALTQGMNELTGGNEHESGFVDVSPDTISYFIGYGLGGMGAFGERAFMKPVGRAAKGKAPFEEWNDVPFMRRFVSEASSRPDMGAYYDHRDKIDQKVDRFEAIRGADKRQYIADNRNYIQFAKVYKMAEKQLRVLRDRQKMLDALIERQPGRAQELAERQEAIQEKIDNVINRVNKLYEQKVSNK